MRKPIKKLINDILRKYGLHTVSLQKGIYEKNGVLRWHEQQDPCCYGLIKCQLTPQIYLFVKSKSNIKPELGEFEFSCYVGAFKNINLCLFDIDEFEHSVKEYLVADSYDY